MQKTSKKWEYKLKLATVKGVYEYSGEAYDIAKAVSDDLGINCTPMMIRQWSVYQDTFYRQCSRD